MAGHDEHPFRDFWTALVTAFAVKSQVVEDGWPRFHLFRRARR